MKNMYTSPTYLIGKTLPVHIDRPLGSRHPTYNNLIYPLNYGYIPNIIVPILPNGDGKELDAYILGIFEPVEQFTGHCIALIHRRDDNDDKLIITPPDKTYTNDQITALIEFQERFFDSTIIRQENSAPSATLR